MRSEWAPYVAVGGAVLALVAIFVAVLAFGVDDTSMPLLFAVLAMLGTVVTGLVAAFKSTEAARSANKLTDSTVSLQASAEIAANAARTSAQVGALTASKVSAIQQALAGDRYHLCHDPLCQEGNGR